MTSKSDLIAEAFADLEQLTAELLDARTKLDEARGHATKCLNRLNAGQKRVDELMSNATQDAPAGSDWARVRLLQPPGPAHTLWQPPPAPPVAVGAGDGDTFVSPPTPVMVNPD